MRACDRLDDLTPREREVFDLLRVGLTNEEIAERLGISLDGAKYHVSQILSKLGVSTREEAATLSTQYVAEAFQPRRGRWWAVLPLAAKAAGVAVVVAAVGGLGVLAWGVLNTSGGTEAGDSALVAVDGPRIGDHWHAPYSFTACGDLQPNAAVWESGVHTHGDGIIHIHPFEEFEEGPGSRLVKWFEYGGGLLTDSEINIPGSATTFRNGELCPDGKPGELQVFVTRVGESSERRLAGDALQQYISHDGDRVRIVFGPPESKIVFAATHDVDFDIYTINIDGVGLTNITDDPGAPDFFPAWSPDRSRIAYFSFQYRSVTPAPADPKATTTVQERYLYIVNADGSGRMRLSDGVPQLHDDNPPVWSPDGSRIAFESEHEGNSEIFVIDVDGSGLRNISNHPAFDSGPTWSSDGRHIAFTSNRDGVDDIYVAAVDGSGTTRLTTAGGRSPAWSPDGTRIAFFSERDGNSELYVMRRDGAAQVNLSNHPAPDFSAPVGHLPPLWAGDSLRIAFLSARDGSTEIYIANADSPVVTRLTNNGADESLASWSPDGPDFIFWAGGSLYAMNASGEGEPQLILDLDATALPSSER